MKAKSTCNMITRTYQDAFICFRMNSKLKDERRWKKSEAQSWLGPEFRFLNWVISQAWKSFQKTGTGKQRLFMTGISSCRRKKPETRKQATLLSSWVCQPNDRYLRLLCINAIQRVPYLPVLFNAAYHG